MHCRANSGILDFVAWFFIVGLPPAFHDVIVRFAQDSDTGPANSFDPGQKFSRNTVETPACGPAETIDRSTAGKVHVYAGLAAGSVRVEGYDYVCKGNVHVEIFPFQGALVKQAQVGSIDS